MSSITTKDWLEYSKENDEVWADYYKSMRGRNPMALSIGPPQPSFENFMKWKLAKEK